MPQSLCRRISEVLSRIIVTAITAGCGELAGRLPEESVKQ